MREEIADHAPVGSGVTHEHIKWGKEALLQYNSECYELLVVETRKNNFMYGVSLRFTRKIKLVRIVSN